MLNFKQTNLGLCPRRTEGYFTRNKVYPVIGLYANSGSAAFSASVTVVVIDDAADEHNLTDNYIKANFDWVLTS